MKISAHLSIYLDSLRFKFFNLSLIHFFLIFQGPKIFVKTYVFREKTCNLLTNFSFGALESFNFIILIRLFSFSNCISSGSKTKGRSSSKVLGVNPTKQPKILWFFLNFKASSIFQMNPEFPTTCTSICFSEKINKLPNVQFQFNKVSTVVACNSVI